MGLEMRWQPINFKGETFDFCAESLILRLHIREPYKVAGRKHGWHPPIGFSINKEALLYALNRGCKIWVTIGTSNKTYQTDAKTWWEFVQKHKSFEEHNGVTLCVIQWSDDYFTRVENPD